MKNTIADIFRFAWGLIRLIRWPNILIMIATMFLMRCYLIKPMYSFEQMTLQTPFLMFLMLVASVVFIAAGGYVINDYFDYRIDEFNNPGKSVLNREIPLKLAIPLHIIFSVIGVVFGFIVSLSVGNFKLVFIHLLMVFLLWLYSSRYKKQPFIGNFVIAFCTMVLVGVTWLFELFAMFNSEFIYNQAEFRWVNRAVIFFMLFSFLLTLAREIVKDVEDKEGDSRYGGRTLPLIIGVRSTKWIVIAIHLITMALLGYVQCYLYGQKMSLLWMYFVVVQFLLIYGFLILIKATDRNEFSFLGQIYRVIMVAGILSLQVYSINL